MRKNFLLAGLTALTAAQQNGFQIGQGFVRFPVTAHILERAAPATSKKRQHEVDVTKIFSGGAYTIQLKIGTPPQPVDVQLDTGSTELWINPNCANANGETQVSYCKSLPSYKKEKSTSFVDTGPQTNLLYGSGNATVEYVMDDVQAGTMRLKNQTFGLALDSHKMPFGILGMGPYLWGNHYYTFFIDNLKAQGLIHSRAFSLDLRSIESDVGSIIFGGLDTGKYVGALTKIPIVPSTSTPDGEPRYWVTLDSVSLKNKKLSTGSLTVLLDSGTTLSLIPSDLHNAIGQNVPTSRLDAGGSGYYIVDCDIAHQTGSIDFQFAGKTIKIAYADIIWTVGTNFCVIGTQPTMGDFFILGDSFLRGAYVVFDLDQQNVHIAQAADCGTHYVAIGEGTDSVPSVTGVCSVSSSSHPSTHTSTSHHITSTSRHTTASTKKALTNSTKKAVTTSTKKAVTTSTKKAITTSTKKAITTSSKKAIASTTKKATTTNPKKTITTTVKHTTVYKITSCPKTVTKCPTGKVTTQVVTKTTTYCPACMAGKKRRHVQLPPSSARVKSPRHDAEIATSEDKESRRSSHQKAP